LKEDSEREASLYKKEADEDEHIFSDKFEKNIKLIEKRIKYKQNAEKIKKAAPKFAATAAAVIVFVSLATNPSVSAFVKDIIVKITGGYNQHEFIGDTKITLENFVLDLHPEYMPEGYKLTQINYGGASVALKYENNYDGVIRINYGIADSAAFGVDNEHSEQYSVSVNGKEAVFYETNAEDRPSYLVWSYKGYSFVATAQIELEEFVKIAKSIKIS